MQIVVARYNENIDHLKIFNDITVIYNKGEELMPDKGNTTFKNIIKLINVGREGHTYLYHIINNYYKLADKTFFMQAKTNDHKMLNIIEYFKDNNFIGKISTLNIQLLKNEIIFDKKYLKEYKKGLLLKSKYTPFNFIQIILGIDISNDIEFNLIWGANFAVSRELIHKKPIEFYKNIIKYLEFHNNPEEGHFFERSWYLIYNHPKFITKNKILYHFCDNINQNIIKKCESIIINDINMNDIDEIHLWTNNIDNNNKNTNIKYLNNYNYINIYPIIKNNSFLFYFSDECNLMLEFNIFNIFEIIFTKTNILVSDIKNQIEYSFEINNIHYFLIKWNNEYLYINDFDIKFIEEKCLDEENTINNIKVKSFNSFITYNINEIYYKRIYIFYTTLNRVNKIFYKDYYEDKYTVQLDINYLL